MPNQFTFSLDRPNEALFTLTATYNLTEWGQLLTALEGVKPLPSIVYGLRIEIAKLHREARQKWVSPEGE